MYCTQSLNHQYWMKKWTKVGECGSSLSIHHNAGQLKLVVIPVYSIVIRNQLITQGPHTVLNYLHFSINLNQCSITTAISFWRTDSLLLWCLLVPLTRLLDVIRHPWFIQIGLFPPGCYLCSHWATVYDLQHIRFCNVTEMILKYFAC